MSAVGRVLKAPLLSLLEWPAFRRRVTFELRQRYYDELEHVVPLGDGLQCPLLFSDAWHSFSEIFVQGEYRDALASVPLPSRWLDLGCHAGFFSLYVAWRRLTSGATDPGAALLVDGDGRMAAPVAQLIRMNGLASQWQFVHGLIAAGDGRRDFLERPVMASSAAGIGNPEGRRLSVPVVPASEIVRRFEPPYDLVKIDIEGGEFDFVTAYGDVLDAARAVILEWHAWHGGGGGERQLHDALNSRGLVLQHAMRSRPAAGRPTGETGINVFVRSGHHGS